MVGSMRKGTLDEDGLEQDFGKDRKRMQVVHKKETKCTNVLLNFFQKANISTEYFSRRL